jgi:hypothetical protein
MYANLFPVNLVYDQKNTIRPQEYFLKVFIGQDVEEIYFLSFSYF